MASQPETVNDTVLYTLRNFYGDKDITVRMLDGSILDIWGPVFVNGNALALIGMLPIASNVEALAGTDNTKVMTPLRVREAGDARYMLLGTGGISQAIADTRYLQLVAGGTVSGITTFTEDMNIRDSYFTQWDGPPKGAIANLFLDEDIFYFIGYDNPLDGSVTFSRFEFNGPVIVPDEVYGVSWNGNLSVPTKNALWDKIETLGSGGGGAVTSVNGETGIVVLNQDEVLDGTTYKQYSQTEKTKLSGIATGATANSSDATLLDRGNHTGTQAISTVTNLQTTLDGKADDADLTGKANLTGGTFSGDISVPDEVYGAGWDGSLEAPTKNALYDKIQTLGAGLTQEQTEDIVAALFAAGSHTNATVTYNDATPSLSIAASGGGGSVSDTVYGAGWNGDTTNAPSKNAVYDKVELLDGLVVHKAGSETITGAKIFTSTIDVNGLATFNTIIADTGMQANGAIQVPDDAYGSGWNGSTQVPTKNAVYDKIETLGGGSSDAVWVGTDAPTDPDTELWWDTDEEVSLDPNYPIGVVAYAQVTANQGSITTEVDLTGLSVTFTAVAGRSYKVTGSTWPQATVNQDDIRMKITDGADVQLQAVQITIPKNGVPFILERSVILSNLSGSTTLKLRMLRNAGTGTIQNNAAANFPSFILVEDMGIL